MNNPVIGIKLSDGTFYPVLKGEGAEKKRLILTVANQGQNKAVIELFRGEGEAMEVPEKIGALVVDDVGGADHDIELVLDRQENGNLKASAKVSGGSQSETIEIRADQGPYIESDESSDMDVLQDDDLAADGIDDFSLEGLESPSFDSTDNTETIEEAGLTVGDTSSDDDLESFDIGGLDDSSPENTASEESADALGDFDLGSLGDGEDAAPLSAGGESTDGLDDLSFDSLDDAAPSAGEEVSQMGDLSLDGGDVDFGDAPVEKTARGPVADFSLDEISLDDDAGSTGSEAITFDDTGSGGSKGASDDFDLGDDFSLDGTTLGDAPIGPLSTDENDDLPDDLAWTPPGEDSLDSGPSDRFDDGEETRQPEEAPAKPPKKEKKSKEKPIPKKKKETDGRGQPDRVSLILGMVVFIPLALLLIILVVLNMVRPAASPPLTQLEAPRALVMGVQEWEEPKIGQQAGNTVPFV